VRSQHLILNPLNILQEEHQVSRSTPPHQRSGLKWYSLPVKELIHFEGMKREDFITFIRHVDEIAQEASWMDKEGVLTVANLLGVHAAQLARWIRTGLSVGQPIG